MNGSVLSAEAWQNVSGTFIALWTGGGFAYALFEGQLVSTALADGAYPALSPRFPAAAWFERLAHDLNGHTATGADMQRSAIEQFRGADGKAPWPDFTPAPGEGVHQMAVGPVHAGIIEPGHFRFSLRGEQVLKLETRLGYSHKGTLALMRGKSPRLAARFAARISGDATVAHGLAFAHAAEAALGLQVPPRAQFLRAVMAEIERIANHAGDIGAIAGDAGFAFLDARLAWHRESFCVAANAAFGHRLMMDMVIPGGIAADIKPKGAEILHRSLDALEAELPSLTRIFENYAGLQDRLVGTGVITRELAASYAPGGFVGRASGRLTDARLAPGYAPYGPMALQVPVETDGDVAARIRIRIAELTESIRLSRFILAELPEGSLAVTPQANNVEASEGGAAVKAGAARETHGVREAVGVAESFRGPVWVWMQLEAGMITDIFVADPSTLHWPLLQHAVLSGIVADFPLINRSINASYSGVDL
jgi:Ni,Fe-hydrogenase III large subunit